MDKRDDTMGQWNTIRDDRGASWQAAPDATIGDLPTLRDEGVVLAGRYKVVKRLGEGGMGSVWLAEDAKLDSRKVAVKMLPAILAGKKGAYKQVKAEALMAMKLSHPNIATVRSFEEDEGGNPFLVMDYIEGEPLDDILAERGPLGEAETVKLLGPVAAALDYAHSQGVVHRDVKPGNVMVRKDGTPFVLDFGIAREVQETMTMVTGKMSSGTLLYMSPEQLKGRAPKAAQDVYSFAAMAYECLAGRPPFSRGQIEWQIVNEAPEELPGSVGEGLRKVVMAGLAKAAGERPESCSAVLGREPQQSATGIQDGSRNEEGTGIGYGGSAIWRRGETRRMGSGNFVFLEEVRLEKALTAAGREAKTASEKEEWGRVQDVMEAGKRALKAGDKLAAARLYEEAETLLDAWKKELVSRREAERKNEEQCRRDEEADRIRRQKEKEFPNVGGMSKTFSLPGGASIEMAWCPPGTFLMGSPDDEEERRNDETLHEVTLTKGFWMAKHEVTQKQWQSVMGNNPSRFKGGHLPVENVSWKDCLDFCRKTGMQLPTEAQWEYACRAGTTGAYGGTGDLASMGWNSGNSGNETHPVGQKPANAWGLYDMHGNVWEWCEDRYGEYPDHAVTDPDGAESGEGRVIRGGSRSGDPGYCRSASRYSFKPDDRSNCLGFRPVRSSP